MTQVWPRSVFLFLSANWPELKLLLQVLLNVRVSGALPVSCRKNNVLLVSPPNPPLEKAVCYCESAGELYISLQKGEEDNGSAPVTYLIRVKTAAMATELLQSLQCSDR